MLFWVQDFIVYLKGEFIDDVYLQQNAFDEVDAATIEERQKYVFHILHEIIGSEFNFENKGAVRKFFQGLRQVFIEWNSSEWQTENFKKQENQIKEKCKKYIIA